MCEIIPPRWVQTLDIFSKGDRSGVLFVGKLPRKAYHRRVAQALSKRLAKRDIDVMCYDLHSCAHRTNSGSPFEDFIITLEKARESEQRLILVVWCLERLSEPAIKDWVRSLNTCRGHVMQRSMAEKRSVPIVLLVDQGTYREYLAGWAGDLIDCLPSF